MTTFEVEAEKKQQIGIVRLVLMDDSDFNHSYDINRCIYDPETPVNVLGFPVISEFFDEAADGPDTIVEDGMTMIMSI